MAAVEITLSGVLYDKLSRTTQQVVLIGDASLTGLGVGGGPMPPGQGGGQPPGIWGGPIDPYPGHGLPGAPGTWPGQNPPHPAHPIVTPPEGPPNGGQPPDPPTADKPPPPEGGWGWMASASQWGYFLGPQQAQPKT
jgi:hypothetical protein